MIGNSIVILHQINPCLDDFGKLYITSPQRYSPQGSWSSVADLLKVPDLTPSCERGQISWVKLTNWMKTIGWRASAPPSWRGKLNHRINIATNISGGTNPNSPTCSRAETSKLQTACEMAWCCGEKAVGNNEQWPDPVPQTAPRHSREEVGGNGIYQYLYQYGAKGFGVVTKYTPTPPVSRRQQEIKCLVQARRQLRKLWKKASEVEKEGISTLHPLTSEHGWHLSAEQRFYGKGGGTNKTQEHGSIKIPSSSWRPSSLRRKVEF